MLVSSYDLRRFWFGYSYFCSFLMLRKIEGKRRREQQRMRWLDSITDSMDLSLVKLQKIVEDRGAWQATIMRSQSVGHDLATEKLLQHLFQISVVSPHLRAQNIKQTFCRLLPMTTAILRGSYHHTLFRAASTCC